MPLNFAVIGNPISHSLSPVMHRAAYEVLGLHHTYEARLVENLDLHIDELQALTGINITVPHKETMLDYCVPNEFARRAGSVNTVDFRTGQGINTDGPGFIDVLKEHVSGARRVLLLGAGGTSRSLALAMSKAGYEISIWNRTESRAQHLINELEIEAQVSYGLRVNGHDVIVNATAASLTGEKLPIEWDQAEPSTLVCDLTYGTQATAFDLEAKSAGLQTIDGRELLIAQGALSFSWWLGIEAPRDAMRDAVYKGR